MRSSRLRCAGGAAAVVGAALLASCGGSQTRSFAFAYSEQHIQLNNGLRVVITPDTSTDLVQVAVRYEVGSREDPTGKAGLAHMVEHLMFQIRPGGSGPPLMEFTRHASSFFNAYTSWDSTHYTTEARADMLDWLLKVEAVRMSHSCDTIPEQEVLREREVVRNEIRQRRAQELVDLMPAVLEAVYPPDHAYARPISGSDADVAGITREDACAFIERFYVPERATLIIAGNVDIKATEAAVVKWFGRIASRRGAARRQVTPVPPTGKRVTRDVDTGGSFLAVAWPLPPASTPDGAAAQMLMSMLSFGARGTVFRKDVATSVQSTILGGPQAPVFVILVKLRSAGDADQALELLREAARDTRRGYYRWARALDSRAERESLEELKVLLKSAYVQSLEPLASRAQIIADLVQFESVTFLSTRAFLAEGLSKIDALQVEQIAVAVERIVDVDRATVVLFRASGRPGRDQRAAFRLRTRSHEESEEPATSPQEASRPVEVPAGLRTLARAERFQLDNGMRVVLLPVGAMPIVALRLVLGAGHAAGPPGVAELAADMLLPPRRADPLDDIGLSVDCSAGADRTTCTLDGINIYLDRMVAGMARTVAEGHYDAGLVERTVQREKRRDEGERAALELQRQVLTALYGSRHPYVRGYMPAPGAPLGPGVEELRAFQRRHYTAGDATLIVAGNFDPAEAKKLVGDAFEDWQAGERARPVSPAARPRSGPEHIGVVGQVGPQTRIVVAYPAPAGIDDQEATRAVVAEMLNLRVERVRSRMGAAYSASAHREPRVGPTAYTATADVDTERAGEALKAIRESVDGMRRGSGLAVDFARARRRVVTELLGQSTVSRELAARLGIIAAFGLPDDFYDSLLRRAAAVTPAQVHALIRSELSADREVVVLLGARAALVEAFVDAGVTAPRYVGVPVR
jgi:zinc protease